MKKWGAYVGGFAAIGLGVFLMIYRPDKFEISIGLCVAGLASLGVGYKYLGNVK